MYQDRTEAGVRLAKELQDMALENPVVLALPRGGVPVALPIARTLKAPLDLFLVRKIGVPGQPEVAAGAIVDGPPEHIHFNERILASLGLSHEDLTATVAAKRAELAERRALWLEGRAPVPVAGRDAVVVDDGIATGATMRAALMALRGRGPRRIILAVPVAAEDTLEALRDLVDAVVCPHVPRYFRAVGLHYRQFDQVPDDAVTRMMAGAPRDTEE